jgi:hypothetical protein
MRPIQRMLAIIICYLIAVIACREDPNKTEIRFEHTVDVLPIIESQIILEDHQRIAGFYISGLETEGRELRQGIIQAYDGYTLPAAGSEVIECRDGRDLVFGSWDEPILQFAAIGDTGGDDVSDDDDCKCDTHIKHIQFTTLSILLEDGTLLEPSSTRIEGRYLFCPNIPEGHLVRGDRDFNGPVMVTGSVHLYVSPDRRHLFAEVQYHVIEAD